MPEDDPTRPPLRLNIPRDVTVSNPYELTSESIYNKLYLNSENEKFTVNEFDSSPMFHGSEMFGSGKESLQDEVKDNLRRTHSNLIMQHNHKSSEMQSDENVAAKTKSNESLMSVRLVEKEENVCNERKFTLKREHITLSNSELKNTDSIMENGIMTIKVSLDNSENREPSSAPGKIEEGINSEEEIRALAAAIVNEVSPKINVDNPKNDTVFVIVNVVDQNHPDNPSQVNSPKSENERKFSLKRNDSKIKVQNMKQSKMTPENLYHRTQDKLLLNNNIPEMKSAENMDSSNMQTDFQLDNCPSSAKTPTGFNRNVFRSNQGVEITEERYEPDITDITYLTNKAKIVSAKRLWSGTACRSNRMKNIGDWRSVLDELKFKLPAKNRTVFRHMGTDNFEMNAQCLNDKFSSKLPIRLMFPGKLYGTGNGIDVGDSLLKNKKGVIINVMKKALEKTPKFSDNVVNLANEGLAEDRGTSSIDSLTFMKNVKEMLDVDFKNAEEIFMISEEEKTSKEREPEKQDLQTVENTETLKITSDAFNNVPIDITHPSTETLLDGTFVNDFDPSKTKSLVIYDDAINKYYINLSELESAMQHQTREPKSMIMYDGNRFSVDENLIGIVDVGSGKFKGNFPFCIEIPTEEVVKEESYFLKKGDSVMFFNEKTKKWKTDFNVVNDKNRGMEKQQSEKANMTAVDESMDDAKYESKLAQNSFAMNSKKAKITVKNDKNSSAKEKISEKKSCAMAKMKKNELSETEKRKGYASRKLKRNQMNMGVQEIQKNSNLYGEVLTEKKRSDSVIKKEGNVKKRQENDCGASKMGTEGEVGTSSERNLKKPHYLSENIAQLSQNISSEKGTKLKTNKYETVKLNMSSMTRPPSKVTEINLNKATDDHNDFTRVRQFDSENKGESPQENVARKKASRSFYKNFERYKSPFGDPEYEEGPLKINSDLKSNPNLNKLESWNKTLVLQDVSKLPENIEYLLKDDADKMATLLLKILQEAAEEKNSKKECSSEYRSKGNPYEAIRKKEEDRAGQMKGAVGVARRRRDSSRGKSGIESRPSIQSTNYVKTPRIVEGVKMIRDGDRSRDRRKKPGKAMLKKQSFPMVEDEMQAEVVSMDEFLQEKTITREQKSSQTMFVKSDETEDIPGPFLLKKFASIWRCLPDLGCQMTIFSLIWIFQMVKLGSSMLTVGTYRTKDDPFGRLFAKYGPVVKLQSPLSGDIVLVNKPRDIASIFTMEQTPERSVFDSAEKCRIWLKQKKFPIGAEDTCAGIEWDALRKSTTDVSCKGCKTYFNSLSHVASLLNNKIHNVRNNQNQVPEGFITEIKKWCLEGMCNILFDEPLGFFGRNNQSQGISESEHLLRHLEEATEYLCKCEGHFQSWRFFNTPAMVGLNNAYQSLDLIMSKYIYQAEINLRKKRKYLKTKKKFDSNLTFIESMLINDRMTPEDLASNLIDILIVGFNTTSIAFGFLLYHLSQNNRVQNHLLKEVTEVLPEKTSILNYHQIHNLKYLQACLKETLRMNTPIPFQLKVLLNDIALSHYWIPLGTHVVMDSQTASMREQSFEEPDKYKPERWLDQSCHHPFASIPFCHGPRSGFVKQLMEVQLWICIAKIVRNYEIEYNLEEIKSSKKVISYPDKPLKMIFNERKK